MGTRVRIIFSCYEQSMQIVIRGNEGVSNNSRLKRYMNEPFAVWFDRILDLLYEELGSRYYLEYCGRIEEARVLEGLAAENSHCFGFTHIPFVLNNSLAVRMKQLSEIVGKNQYYTMHKIILKAEFLCSKAFLQKWEAYLKALEISNHYCSVEKRITALNEDNAYGNADIKFIMLANTEEPPAYLNRIGSKENTIILVESANNRVALKNGRIVYEYTADQFYNTIFEAFFLIPLVNVFNTACGIYYEKALSGSEKLRMAMLQAISPITNVRADLKIEKGCLGSIKFWTDPPGYPIPPLDFRYQFPDIVDITSEGVRAINPGTTIVQVYERGSVKTIGTLEFTVYERNRISTINLSHTSLFLGIGDRCRLGCEYFPEDADNVDSITWSSDNTSVAYVEDGIVTVCGAGKCTITCSADNVAEKCELEARPYLREISLPEELVTNPLVLYVGETYKLEVILVPSNAYDGELTYYSSNYLVVNVNQGLLKAVSKGKAVITIENITQSLRTVLEIIVKDKKKPENAAACKYYNFLRRV